MFFEVRKRLLGKMEAVPRLINSDELSWSMMRPIYE